MNQIETPIAGGCQWGAVRYGASAVLDSAHICHCRMFQKTVGNFFAALMGMPRDAFEWTRGQPALFKSSDPVTRGFCRDCGTPLLYDYAASKHLNVTIGSFDNPALFPPQVQFGIEARMPWFGDLCLLPDEGSTEETMTDYVHAIRSSNRQHPDHDADRWPL